MSQRPPFLRRQRPVVGVALICATSAAAVASSVYYVHRLPVGTDPHPSPDARPSAALSDAVPRATLGRCAAAVAAVPLPSFLRVPTYKRFASLVHCPSSTIPDDAALRRYPSLSAFIARAPPRFPADDHEDERLESNTEATTARKTVLLTSPCHGVVQALGTAGPFASVRVKNHSHSIRELLGAEPMDPLSSSAVDVDRDVKAENDQVSLWYMVISLRLCDPHTFISPTEWNLSTHRLVPGTLFCPSVQQQTSRKNDAGRPFTMNERVAMVGNWTHGLFSLVAIGAAARRTIVLTPPNATSAETTTDTYNTYQHRAKDAVVADHEYEVPRKFIRGQPVGAFRMGSAIALVFEAPTNGLEFAVRTGDAIVAGQPLASLVVNGGGHNKNKGRNTGRSWWDIFGLFSSDTPSVGEPQQQQERAPSSRERFRRAW